MSLAPQRPVQIHAGVAAASDVPACFLRLEGRAGSVPRKTRHPPLHALPYETIDVPLLTRARIHLRAPCFSLALLLQEGTGGTDILPDKGQDALSLPEGAGSEFYREARGLGLRPEVSLLPNGAESRKGGAGWLRRSQGACPENRVVD